jgi:SAM-dependent methyltransferase
MPKSRFLRRFVQHIPILRRPFWQRDKARAERDGARTELSVVRQQYGDACAERDGARTELSVVRQQYNIALNRLTRLEARLSEAEEVVRRGPHSNQHSIGSPHSYCSEIGVQNWLNTLPQHEGIFFLSEDRRFAHPEDAYDSQVGGEVIETTIGEFVLSHATRRLNTILEIACGTGRLTASLVYTGKIKTLVASDASTKFLKLTQRKITSLPEGTCFKLLRLADSDFECIPANLFDAIMLRSALHHFVDFRRTASTLIGKLRPGGLLYMMEPRADFHITASLLLKAAKTKYAAEKLSWSPMHELAVTQFIDTARFYLDRQMDKSLAEDKYVFFIDELTDIANDTGTSITCIGGEDVRRYSRKFREYMIHLMQVDVSIVDSLMAVIVDELEFMDFAHSSRPRYSAAEWFMFKKP